ncbi:MAG TPA: type II toxin-antitoxin system antitoxin SocA domain-containing protein [Mycobacteriales bacterium]|nr:type II toxin-antitoxin system antitoxin SocA domain-containing protein [Mycobacteriales bacterium]
MVLSAHDVAAELRRRMPGLPTVKLHKLLYYCQGHHLADLSEPLFAETITAWDMGPVVGELWRAEKDGETPPPAKPLDEGALNTIGYVMSRYGALTGNDLKHLTHAEMPWLRANKQRQPGRRVRIEAEWLADYFRFEDTDPDDPTEIRLPPHVVSELLRDATHQPVGSGRPDTREELLARLHR